MTPHTQTAVAAGQSGRTLSLYQLLDPRSSPIPIPFFIN